MSHASQLLVGFCFFACLYILVIASDLLQVLILALLFLFQPSTLALALLTYELGFMGNQWLSAAHYLQEEAKVHNILLTCYNFTVTFKLLNANVPVIIAPDIGTPLKFEAQ